MTHVVVFFSPQVGNFKENVNIFALELAIKCE